MKRLKIIIIILLLLIVCLLAKNTQHHFQIIEKDNQIEKLKQENKLEKKSEDSCQSSLFLFLLHKTLQTNIR